MHHTVAGYHVSDIEFVAAFDVAAAKVGQDLSAAILAGENNTVVFAQVAHAGVTVQRGPTLDGIGQYLGEVVELSDGRAGRRGRRAARDARPTCSSTCCRSAASRRCSYYAEQALAAGCGFVNCIPVFIAGKPEWRARFEEAGVPIIGDDIKSQVGATILHRRIAQLFRDRGVKVLRTSQLNVGGNSDFRNMLERSRLDSKKISKTNAVTSVLPYDIGAEERARRSRRTTCRGSRTASGRTSASRARPSAACRSTWRSSSRSSNSPNSAGITIDAVRMCKSAMDRGIGGALEWSSAYLMKSPPWQHDDDVAREQLEAFLAGGPAGRSAAERGAEERRADGGVQVHVERVRETATAMHDADDPSNEALRRVEQHEGLAPA